MPGIRTSTRTHPSTDGRSASRNAIPVGKATTVKPLVSSRSLSDSRTASSSSTMKIVARLVMGAGRITVSGVCPRSEADAMRPRQPGWTHPSRRSGRAAQSRRRATEPIESGARPHLGVREAQLCTFLVGCDLLERLGKIELEIVPFGPAEMRQAERVRHGEQWVIAADDWLFLIDIDRCVAGPPCPQGGNEGAGLNELGARRIDDER